jgi:hypothetical protein
MDNQSEKYPADANFKQEQIMVRNGNVNQELLDLGGIKKNADLILI